MFHENPPSGGRIVPRGQTDMTKLVVAFRKFVHVLKKQHKYMAIHEYNFAVSYNYARCLMTTFRNAFPLTG